MGCANVISSEDMVEISPTQFLKERRLPEFYTEFIINFHFVQSRSIITQ